MLRLTSTHLDRSSRRTTVVLAAISSVALFGCCGGGDGTTTSLREVTGDVDHRVVAVVDRSVPPDGSRETERSNGRALLVDDLAGAWSAWGPATSDPPAPPELGEGSQALLVWVPGSSAELSELSDLSGDLRIEVSVAEPADGCGTDAERHGATLVIELSDRVTPGEIEVEVRSEETSC